MKIYEGKIKPHINLVYPFEVSNQKKLENHIKNSIKDIFAFNLIMGGLQKSAKEYYLYLLVKKGKEEVMNLYKRLNSGILSSFKNLDMPEYIPHITLGVFNSEKEINKAYRNPKLRRIKFTQKIKQIDLVTFEKDNSQKSIKSFKLK